MAYVPLRKAIEYFGVCANTLRKWADEGKIETIRTPGGRRLFKLNSLNRGARRKVCYCRVSSRNQRDDLKNQIRYMSERFPDHEIVYDIGSGLNWNRKKFNELLESILRGEVDRVVVAHKDRLCRFGFELLEKVAAANGCELVVLNDSSLSPAEELVNDLVSIIHVFSCRLYGLRKYATAVSKDPDLPRRREQKTA